MSAHTSRSAVDSQRAFGWYEHWAARDGERCALWTPDERLTYRELAERIAAERAALTQAGWRCGDRMLNDHPPGSPRWLTRLVAALDVGLQVVQPDEDWPLEHVAAHVAPLLERAPSPSAPAGVWLFTSGTTERPKPRLRSLPLLRSDVNRVRQRLPHWLQTRQPVSLSLLPLSHGFGLINSLLLIHALGGTVLIENIDRRQNIARLLQKHPVEVLYSWPGHLEALSDPALWRQARTPLAWCVSSSLRLAEHVAARFSAASGCPVRQQYGSTETGPLSLDTSEPPHPSTACVGTPLDGVAVRVLAADHTTLPADHEGELAVKLEHLSLDRAELTADGYWRTGDRGCVDAEGRIHVYGRLKPFTDERAPTAQEKTD